ncbi:MAG: hypothetical protein FWE43_01470 [Streptococcaceae bacterium]|nr:hypothetical protein [Streptococcaceae bacterium]MCL2681146.1 hypothetical protein [Streptococcaceae bacterium]
MESNKPPFTQVNNDELIQLFEVDVESTYDNPGDGQYSVRSTKGNVKFTLLFSVYEYWASLFLTLMEPNQINGSNETGISSHHFYDVRDMKVDLEEQELTLWSEDNLLATVECEYSQYFLITTGK